MQAGDWRSRREHDVQLGAMRLLQAPRADFMQIFRKRYRFDGWASPDASSQSQRPIIGSTTSTRSRTGMARQPADESCNGACGWHRRAWSLVDPRGLARGSKVAANISEMMTRRTRVVRAM